jgi:Fic family protein
MPALFDLIEKEPEPGVRAVLGHWLFGYIHPYPDGNGRIARFLMNVLLARDRYPWTVIRVEERDAYLRSLELASVDGNVRPFAAFVVDQMKKTSVTKRPRSGRAPGSRRPPRPTRRR